MCRRRLTPPLRTYNLSLFVLGVPPETVDDLEAPPETVEVLEAPPETVEVLEAPPDSVEVLEAPPETVGALEPPPQTGGVVEPPQTGGTSADDPWSHREQHPPSVVTSLVSIFVLAVLSASHFKGLIAKGALGASLRVIVTRLACDDKKGANIVGASVLLGLYAASPMLEHYGYELEPLLTEDDVVVMTFIFVLYGFLPLPKRDIDPEARPCPTLIPLQEVMYEECFTLIGIVFTLKTKSIFFGIAVILSHWQYRRDRNQMVPKGTAGYLDVHRVLLMQSFTFVSIFINMTNMLSEDRKVQSKVSNSLWTFFWYILVEVALKSVYLLGMKRCERLAQGSSAEDTANGDSGQHAQLFPYELPVPGVTADTIEATAGSPLDPRSTVRRTYRT